MLIHKFTLNVADAFKGGTVKIDEKEIAATFVKVEHDFANPGPTRVTIEFLADAAEVEVGQAPPPTQS